MAQEAPFGWRGAPAPAYHPPLPTFRPRAAISKTWLGGRRYFTVVLRDITARKHAEEVLRRSEERSRQLAESVREVFWIREADSGAVDYVSPAYDEIFGRSRRLLYEDPGSFIDLVHPGDMSSVLATWENAAAGGPPTVFRIIREDAAPFTSGASPPAIVIGVMHVTCAQIETRTSSVHQR